MRRISSSSMTLQWSHRLLPLGHMISSTPFTSLRRRRLKFQCPRNTCSILITGNWGSLSRASNQTRGPRQRRYSYLAFGVMTYSSFSSICTHCILRSGPLHPPPATCAPYPVHPPRAAPSSSEASTSLHIVPPISVAQAYEVPFAIHVERNALRTT